VRTLLLLFLMCLLSCGGGDGKIVASATLGDTFPSTILVSGLTAPSAMALAPDGRVFICEQGGTLRIVKHDVLLAAPFLTVPVDSTGERGLIGVALDPGFATNGFVYLHYTALTPATHNRVSRFTAAGDQAVSGSEVVLLELDDLSSATNHNGGALHFGPDGKLYVSAGDNANGTSAQLLTNLEGKLLRMNSDGSTPPDNPFVAQTTGKNQLIWALGLRNPFSFAFQPGTGRLFLNDVGASSWEEIDVGLAGANYGWPATEGPTTNPAYTSPLFAYPHLGGSVTGCAIVGSAFYDPATSLLPAAFQGKYLFMDFCGGWIRTLDPATGTVSDWLAGFNSPVDLLVEPSGAVLVLSSGGGGTLARIT
jgi:glucose/arabinose dehydrogenase